MDPTNPIAVEIFFAQLILEVSYRSNSKISPEQAALIQTAARLHMDKVLDVGVRTPPVARA